ncbi:toll/interleukin-1 receptor domain-containing protein [Hymenobacter ruricola]|uniref:TIR domain-containing protein n=1 Tax=Hymenobacter ruricola TaxID=2791023 RepID=A0ABS0I4U6_9BACT|nr:toll/interleukin-1 receptor domain-containing protein [Hymenobacter ruricola]MBF9221971.1 TIR domain-containing protein [Hymenobacter ruricola]
MPASARTSVFISYSHADEKWRKLLETHFAPLKRHYENLRIWSDQNLNEGEPWLARIREELATAKVGILLVSRHFMASDFIHSDELPPLLAAAKEEGVTLLPVIVGHCTFKGSPLGKLQAFNKPDKPLADLTPSQRDKEMVRLCEKISKLLNLKPAKPAAAKPAAAARKPKAAATAATPEPAPPLTAAAIARRRAIAKRKSEATAAKKTSSKASAPKKPTADAPAPKRPAARKAPAKK